MKNNKDHWEKIFSTKTENKVSWFQQYPKTSVEFFELFNLPLDANLIDIGGGDSHLVDVFIEKGYKNIYILDISVNAIERTKKRLGVNADKVHWIVTDILDFRPSIKFDFWHDRAAFHFLTLEENINRYVEIAEKSINPEGYLILGTFSESGPDKCSGLKIIQYNETGMSARFEKSFERIKCIEVGHVTPFDTIQNFLFCSFRRLK